MYPQNSVPRWYKACVLGGVVPLQFQKEVLIAPTSLPNFTTVDSDPKNLLRIYNVFRCLSRVPRHSYTVTVLPSLDRSDRVSTILDRNRSIWMASFEREPSHMGRVGLTRKHRLNNPRTA